MLPTLIEIRFDTPFSQAVLYGSPSCCSGTASGQDGGTPRVGGRQDGQGPPADDEQRTRRAAIYGVLFAVLIYVGLGYALPSTAFLGGKGEGFPLHTYGLMLMSGFLAAILVSARLAEREWGGAEGVRRRNDVMDLAVWVVVSAFVGSKILFILVTPREFPHALGSAFSEPSKLVGALGGGFVFYGGSSAPRGRVVVLPRQEDPLPATRGHHRSHRRAGAGVRPSGLLRGGLLLGKAGLAPRAMGGAVSRARSRALDLFGQHTSAAIAWSSQSRGAQAVGHRVDGPGVRPSRARRGADRRLGGRARHDLPIHPTQLYESLAQLLLFVALMIARRYRRFHGQILALYLIGYSIIRTTVELFRGDFERGTLHKLIDQVPLDAWWNISTSQLISLVMFALGVTLLVRRAPWAGASRPPRARSRREPGGCRPAHLRRLAPRPGDLKSLGPDASPEPRGPSEGERRGGRGQLGAGTVELDEVEAALHALRGQYEQYFIGMEKRPPVWAHDQFRKRMTALKTVPVRNSALTFRIQSLQAAAATYERLWARTLQEIEDGTYRRDIFKARRRRKNSQPQLPAAAPAGQSRHRRVPRSRAGRAGRSPRAHHPHRRYRAAGAASENRLRSVYRAYVEAKRRCNEDTTRLSFDAVAASLKRQVPELLERHKARDVEYRVFVKDGKAILRAVPKFRSGRPRSRSTVRVSRLAIVGEVKAGAAEWSGRPRSRSTVRATSRGVGPAVTPRFPFPASGPSGDRLPRTKVLAPEPSQGLLRGWPG